MLSRTACVLSLATFPALLAACDTGSDDGLDRVQSYREAWGAADAPSLLDPSFNYTLAQLPTSGEAERIPWAGSYWPTYKDSINDRWAGPGTQSPAKKYELAFGKTGVENAVSTYSGIDSLVGTACTSDADCAANQGSVCAKRAGATQGLCSETWFGIGHAWSSAAILEEEPRNPFTYGGVVFEINDIKALVSLAYTAGLEVRSLSLRCEANGSKTDITGTAACKDTNPGSFHVTVANLLGVQGKAFVEDRTYDYQAWNQPVRGFKVTKNVELTAQQANQLLDAGPVLSQVMETGTVAAGVWQAVPTATIQPGQTLKVRMSGTGDADLYVRWNDQPTLSTYNCRSSLKGSDEACKLVAPANANAAHIAVYGRATSSKYRVVTQVLGTPPATYAFNPAAASLRQVQMELSWIGESPSHVDGNLSTTIEQYTHKDVYDYVLELDASGKIIGGEWLGSSRSNHPDFLWLPVKKSATSATGMVQWSDVQKLLALSVDGAQPTVLLNDTSTITNGAWKHYTSITLDAASAKATLTLTSGDADLYVRKGSQPDKSNYDCRPYAVGNSSETCTLAGPGTFYVSVRGYASSSSYTLEVVKP